MLNIRHILKHVRLYFERRNRTLVSVGLDSFVRDSKFVHLLAKTDSLYKNNFLINTFIASYAPNSGIAVIVTLPIKAHVYKEQIEKRGSKAVIVSLDKAGDKLESIQAYIDAGTAVILAYSFAHDTINDADLCSHALIKIFDAIGEPLRSVNNGDQTACRHLKANKRLIIIDGAIGLLENRFPYYAGTFRALGFKIVVAIQNNALYQSTIVTDDLLANCFLMTDSVEEVANREFYVGKSLYDVTNELFLEVPRTELDALDISNKYFYLEGDSTKTRVISIC